MIRRRAADDERTGAGRLGAIRNEVLGGFKIGWITIVTHGRVKWSEIPGSEAAANDSSGLNSAGGSAFDSAKHAAGLEQQDGRGAEIAAAAQMVTGEGAEDEQWLAPKTEFPVGIGRRAWNIGGPWSVVGIMQFLEQVPAGTGIPVVGLQLVFRANEDGEGMAFFGMFAGQLDQFVESGGVNSGGGISDKGIAQSAFLFRGDGKVTGVAGIKHVAAKFGVDGRQPVGPCGGWSEQLFLGEECEVEGSGCVIRDGIREKIGRSEQIFVNAFGAGHGGRFLWETGLNGGRFPTEANSRRRFSRPFPRGNSEIFSDDGMV